MKEGSNYGTSYSMHSVAVRDEARAMCGLCANKEFLVIYTLLLTAADAAYIYYVVVRISGSKYLPFPTDQTALHDASIDPVMSWVELGTFILDLCSVSLLSLSSACRAVRFPHGPTRTDDRCTIVRSL